MKLTCPICQSSNITNKGNGQDYAPRDENDELYVGLDNDYYDGPVERLECEHGHRFYMPTKDADEGYDLIKPVYPLVDDDE